MIRIHVLWLFCLHSLQVDVYLSVVGFSCGRDIRFNIAFLKCLMLLNFGFVLRGTIDQRSDSGMMPVKDTEHWHRLAREVAGFPSLEIPKGQSGHGPGQLVVLVALPEQGFGPDDLQSCLPTSNIL